MKNEKDHITTYSAADIQRYLKGHMSAGEMHAMEKAALDDPFLADAMEGMEQTMQEDPAVIDAQLHDLRRQLAVRTSTEKTTPVVVKSFRWWYAAAAAMVVILAGIWLFNQNTSNTSQELAVSEKKEAQMQRTLPADDAQASSAADSAGVAMNATIQPPDTGSYRPPAPPAAVTTVPPSAKTVSAATHAPQESEKKALADLASERSAEPAVENKASAQPESPALVAAYEVRRKMDSLANTDRERVFARNNTPVPRKEEKLNDLLRKRSAGITVSKDKNQVNDFFASDTVAMPTEVVRVTGDLKSKQLFKPESGNSNNSNLQNFVKGRVIDQYNNPISNASLRIENNKNIYATDNMGYFKIPTNDSVVNVSVDVVGYQTQQFKLNNNQNAAVTTYNNILDNNLRMQANSLALAETVTVGYGTQKKKVNQLNRVPSVMVQDAAPDYGWVLFEQYLQKNKRPPADNPLVTGEVVVSFTVNKKGELSDFHIEQPLAKGYDEDAIRLIKDGPSWKLIKGRKAKITVIVRY